MNTLKDKHCIFCGSTLYKRKGKPHCSGDNLKATQAVFDGILSFEASDPHQFSLRMELIQEDEFVHDMFLSYWQSKKKDPEAYIQCIHEETYKRSLKIVKKELPLPEAHIPFPDLAEVYIAEIMLGRELTHLEKEGSRYIPKISENGDHYLAPLTWIKYPRDYMSQNQSSDKIDSLEPLPVVFDIEQIRGMYSDRDGGVTDGVQHP